MSKRKASDGCVVTNVSNQRKRYFEPKIFGGGSKDFKQETLKSLSVFSGFFGPVPNNVRI